MFTSNVHAKIKASGSHSITEKQTPPFCYKRPSLQKVLKDIVASWGVDSDFKTILAFEAKKKKQPNKQTTEKKKKCDKMREYSRKGSRKRNSKPLFFLHFPQKKKSELADGKRQPLLKWPNSCMFLCYAIINTFR